jgi:1-aminocyclopropane-1-carboxylate deaminase/D-cysteine desulfhydrase-like pyridoxal-dependent ACC family enzyme
MIAMPRQVFVCPDTLWERVKRLPRLKLVHLPTPLEDCPRLSQTLGGPRILIKRDDLTGLAFGGNKSRNLEFRLAEAVKAGADTIVARLDVQSNSARQTVAAANKLGMRTYLLLQGRADPPWQGNLLVDALLGAEIRLIDDEDANALKRASEGLMAELRAQGRQPYSLLDSPMFAPAAGLAYVICVLEMREQLAQVDARADYVYLSSGSKGQAGVMLGARALGMSFQTVGITAHPRPLAVRQAETARIANETAAMLDLDIRFEPEEVINEDAYAGQYGVPTEGGLEAIRLLAQTEGILVDPVYSGKAMAGLIDHIRQGKFNPEQTVVFIHTGGTPALFSHASAILGELYRRDKWPWLDRG